MDLSELAAELDTDLAGAAARLDSSDGGPRFTLPANRIHKAKAEIKASRRGIKALIRPENARMIVPLLIAFYSNT